MVRAARRLLCVAALSLVALVGTTATASAVTWVYHSHYATYGDCEQAWQNMHAGSIVAGPHQCLQDASSGRWLLWYYV
ncbi:hypothetical protein GCM10014715_89660 [Streptomyces spiralis]|uniref:Secreted protein n=1 Tax=Streptomyces spiralis TaxID=66376 RepID=A0A919E5R7_9ACTN|nr:hypothetical protein GCM10014715_89660 [Streptomyces spiralis]